MTEHDSTWEWECPDCGTTAEVAHPGDDGAVECPDCDAAFTVSRRPRHHFGRHPA